MILSALALALAAPAAPLTPEVCERELVVLGAGQDAGAPQIGNAQDQGAQLWPSSIAVIDREDGARYLFDATPAITEQLALLDKIAAPAPEQGLSQNLGPGLGPGLGQRLGLNGIFLTHAHIGHYLGLAYLGREAAGAQNVPVFAMPRMAEFLRVNGPWSQLVTLGNIELGEMAAENFTVLSDTFGVMPILAPHRDEYSETVGFFIMTPGKRALYMPDLDSWAEFAQTSEQGLEELVTGFDLLFIDATFWDDDELPGRDMSAIPHPRVNKVMQQLSSLSAEDRAKVHFIHYNHTNPIRDPNSAEAREVAAKGFAIARRGMRFCLSE